VDEASDELRLELDKLTDASGHDTNHLKAWRDKYEKREIQCRLCSKKLIADFRIFLNHVMTIHAPKRHECPVCKKKFARAAYLNVHKNMHDDENALECGECGKKFISNQTLEDHVKRIHQNEFSTICSLCGKEIKSGKFALKEHMSRYRRRV
jgi:uncharacterized Zn-finger protein